MILKWKKPEEPNPTGFSAEVQHGAVLINILPMGSESDPNFVLSLYQNGNIFFCFTFSSENAAKEFADNVAEMAKNLAEQLELMKDIADTFEPTDGAE